MRFANLTRFSRKVKIINDNVLIFAVMDTIPGTVSRTNGHYSPTDGENISENIENHPLSNHVEPQEKENNPRSQSKYEEMCQEDNQNLNQQHVKLDIKPCNNCGENDNSVTPVAKDSNIVHSTVGDGHNVQSSSSHEYVTEAAKMQTLLNGDDSEIPTKRSKRMH